MLAHGAVFRKKRISDNMRTVKQLLMTAAVLLCSAMANACDFESAFWNQLANPPFLIV